MKKLHFHFFVCAMLLTVFCGCGETESECGEHKEDQFDAQGHFFSNPADIYWGVTSGVRSFTYNYTFGNICTKQNPKVKFVLTLLHSNNGSANPISVSAGIWTCLGVQAQQVTMIPAIEQDLYSSNFSEIGMQQCFSGQSSATLYPYMTVSFNTLGSSHEDSLYLLKNIIVMQTYLDYYVPK